MHLVVDRFVKPWTKHIGVGLALMLNAGHLSLLKGIDAEDYCKAQIFISHTWNEEFRDFATTIKSALCAEYVVWICIFAIWQHGDVAQALSDLETCPFAKAMKCARRVLVLTDRSAEAFQ